MRKNYFPVMSNENSVLNLEFDKWKREIFSYVAKTFVPSSANGTDDDYVFYIDKERWTIRYDRGIKCWLFIIGYDLIINLYDEPSDIFIDRGGSIREWHYGERLDEQQTKRLLDEVTQIETALRTVAIEQEKGTRKIVFPKKKQHGSISRKDYYAGMDGAEHRQNWALAFTEDDIKYIDKEPVVAPITLREYFRLCRAFYLSYPEWFKNVPDDPKEAYMRFADGRTERMEDVDLDDAQDFYDWEHRQGRWKGLWQVGGHPHEIAGKTYLYAHYTEGLNGYYVWRVAYVWRNFEAAKFCREPNVLLDDRALLIEIIKGNGTLEVVPSIYPYGYPNREYQEPVRYCYLTRKQRAKVKWDPLTEAQIKK